MSARTTRDFDSESDRTPIRLPGQLSSNGHWVFGSFFAALILVGFGFGVWVGAAKPKPPEVADAKKDKEKDPGEKPSAKPPVAPPNPNPPSDPSPVVEPKPNDPDPKPNDPEPKPKDPPPKPRDPPIKTPDVKAVSFKEVQPILRAYCFECHGGSTKKPDGGVDVTSIAKMLKSKGPPLVQGKPDDSAIWLTVKSGDMPPDGKKKPNDKEKQLIHDWIASGAKERRRPIRARMIRRKHPARRLELTNGAEAG